jgi:hypothetical protein
MSIDIQEYLAEHPNDRVEGKTIYLEVETFEGRKRVVEHVVTDYDLG